MIPSYYIYQICVSITLFIILLLFVYNNRSSILRLDSVKDRCANSLLIIFSILAFYDTDYYHYKANFEYLIKGQFSSLEDVYTPIALFTKNYTLFRTIIWGFASLLLYATIVRFKLNTHVALYIFVTIFLLKFCYGRVSLSMALAYYGLSYLVIPYKNKLFSYTLGFAIIFSSFFFHKSAPFGIIVVCCSLIPIRRKLCLVSLLFFPMAVFLVKKLLTNIMDFNGSEEVMLNVASAQGYMSRDSEARGIAGLIRIILERAPYYICVYIYIRAQFKNQISKWSVPYRTIANATYITIYLSSIFLFNLSVDTTVIYYRLLYFAMIPTTMFFSVCYMKNLYKKLINYAIGIGLFAQVYTLLYNCYLNI